jgi:hypothetical protein
MDHLGPFGHGFLGFSLREFDHEPIRSYIGYDLSVQSWNKKPPCRRVIYTLWLFNIDSREP